MMMKWRVLRFLISIRKHIVFENHQQIVSSEINIDSAHYSKNPYFVQN